jgi:hypothetical protein
MSGKEQRLPYYDLAHNQPELMKNRPRPRIHQLSKKQIRNFWKRVDQSPGCWNWTGGHNGAGRGLVKLYAVQMLAPRVSYALHNGVDPGNWNVLHTCDNPNCVNPEHLFLGTQQDNANDRAARGRFVASCGRTKIKPGSREESVLLDESIPVTVVAKMLGVDPKTVWQRRRKAGKGSTTRGRQPGMWKSGTWKSDSTHTASA